MIPCAGPNGQTFWSFGSNDENFESKFVARIVSLAAKEVLLSSRCTEYEVIAQLLKRNMVVTVRKQKVNVDSNAVLALKHNGPLSMQQQQGIAYLFITVRVSH